MVPGYWYGFKTTYECYWYLKISILDEWKCLKTRKFRFIEVFNLNLKVISNMENSLQNVKKYGWIVEENIDLHESGSRIPRFNTENAVPCAGRVPGPLPSISMRSILPSFHLFLSLPCENIRQYFICIPYLIRVQFNSVCSLTITSKKKYQDNSSKRTLIAYFLCLSRLHITVGLYLNSLIISRLTPEVTVPFPVRTTWVLDTLFNQYLSSYVLIW